VIFTAISDDATMLGDNHSHTGRLWAKVGRSSLRLHGLKQAGPDEEVCEPDVAQSELDLVLEAPGFHDGKRQGYQPTTMKREF
jgi:hypothetical protein